MRVNVHSERFELTPQLRHVVVSRLQSALGPFSAHIDSVAVRLQTSWADTRPDTTTCDIAVSLRPSGEVRTRAEDEKMEHAFRRASSDIRGAVEREVSRRHAAPRTFHAADVRPDVLDLALRDNKISQQQRECLDRPENCLRPIRIREYWRPPGVENDELPLELLTAVQ